MIKNKTVLTNIVILLIGFIVSGLVMAVSGYNPATIYQVLFKGVFGSAKSISYTIIKAAPIIMTGLSIALANRGGMFNIGAEGQYLMGTVAAAMVGAFIPLPVGVHPIAVLLAGALAGALLGGVSGALKAKFGINEVISGIMFNWIAFYFHNFVVRLPGVELRSNVSQSILPSAEITIMPNIRDTEAGAELLKNNKLLSDIFATPVNLSIVIAIALAVVVWFLLKKTTVGYKIKAVGASPLAAEFAGIAPTRYYVLTMCLAGGIAGLAGGAQVAGVARNIATLAATEGYGFNGIAVALIGNNTAIGCVFAGFLFAILSYGGTKIQQPPVSAPTEIINIMIGIIILLTAMPALIEEIGRRIRALGDRRTGTREEDSDA